MVVDYERAWLRLREVVLSQRSHGQDGLLRAMARLELENELPEGERGFSSLPPAVQGGDEPPADGAAALGREPVMASH